MYCPWNSPGQNTGVGNLSLFQGISPTQGSNSRLLAFPPGNTSNGSDLNLSFLSCVSWPLCSSLWPCVAYCASLSLRSVPIINFTVSPHGCTWMIISQRNIKQKKKDIKHLHPSRKDCLRLIGLKITFSYLLDSFPQGLVCIQLVPLPPTQVIHNTLNCGVGKDSWESLGQQGDATSQS